MSRFYVPKESVRGNKIFISGKEAHHILDVMRLGNLDKVTAFDGTGNEYTGFIKEAKRDSLVVEIITTRRPSDKSRAKLTLIQSIPKKEKMDYIVEKATELGVYSVIPVMTKRTIVRWDREKKVASVGRWRRIAKETSKQCARSDIPRIEDIVDYDEALQLARSCDLGLIAALDDSAVRLKDALKSFTGGAIAVLIGPEGDFTPQEIEKAKSGNFKLVSLGPRVLKSDTAGLFVLSALNYELSE